MTNPKVYLETTIVSYLTAWPSRDLVRAAHQQITQEWWQNRRGAFDLSVSELVLQEVSAGDPEAARLRLEALTDIEVLEVTDEATTLTEQLVNQVPLPAKAAADALHISIAVVNAMDYLLTWNCTRIANATLRAKIDAVCRANGYDPPVICTPEELLEQNNAS
jgi:hypothetical protein